tara:strand:+ start:264 stop:521 length:258 start_codon:yes stop_codon:yes gene_type:complete
MSDDIECCEKCSYWEDRADINTDSEIKMKVKKIEETKILAIPNFNNNALSGNNKAESTVDDDRLKNVGFVRLKGLATSFLNKLKR